MEEREYLELREWAPMTDLWERVPATTGKFLLKDDVRISCLDAVENFLALGTASNGVIFWYNRATKHMDQFKCPAPVASLTSIKIVSSVEYLVAAGDALGHVFIFQIPKDIPQDILRLSCITAGAASGKPKQYQVRDLHTGPVKCLEWSKNGMKLFSGDRSGNILLTELDLVKGEISSSVILNEAYEIVQIRFQQPRWLLISSIFRTVICEKSDINHWRLRQVGVKDRKLLSLCGGTFIDDDRRPPFIICSRPGGRFWIADVEGVVQKTLVYKDISEARRPDVSLVNPSRKFMKITNEFQRLHSYLGDYCVTSNADAVFVLNLQKNRVEATVKYLRSVLDVSVNEQEIFILEGPRSIVRISPSPDPSFAGLQSPSMSTTNSLYETPMGSRSDEDGEGALAGASECQELTPIEHLDIAKLLSWSVNGEAGEEGPREEHDKKLEVFERINQETFDDNILFRSRRLKVVEAMSPGVEQKGIVEIAQLARADSEEQEEQHRDIQLPEKDPEEEHLPRSDLVPEDPQKGAEGEEETLTEGEGEDEEMDQSIVMEIHNYSSNFISDLDLREMVNGMTSSWKGATPEPRREFMMEAIYLSEIKDVASVDDDVLFQVYCESENEDDELLASEWEFVSFEDCEDQEESDDSEWEIITDEEILNCTI